MVASSHLLKNALYSKYFVYDFKHSAFFRRICTALSAWNNFWRLMKRQLPLYYSHVWLKPAMILAVQLTVWMCLVVISGREVGERRLLFPRRVFSIRWRRLWSDVKYSHTTGKPMMASKPVRYICIYTATAYWRSVWQLCCRTSRTSARCHWEPWEGVFRVCIRNL